MDPKSPIANASIPIVAAISIVETIGEIEGKEKNWGKNARKIIEEMVDASEGGLIFFKDVNRILQAAHTSKMFGSANKGLGHVKQILNEYAKSIIPE